MSVHNLAHNLSQLWHLGIQKGHQFDQRMDGWPGILISTFKKTFKPESVINAAAIAYFAIFSLFPFTLLTIAIASYSFGSLMDQHTIVQRFEFVAPALGQLLGKNIDEIISARGPVTIVALISMIWSASTLFFVLTGVLNEIWSFKHRRPVWKRRGLALLVVLVVVTPILFLASMADNLTTSLLPSLPHAIMQLAGGIGVVIAILLDICLFMVLYMMLPHANSSWREILPGAIIAGLFWETAKKAFLFFVTSYMSISNMIYGSVAAVIAILTWAYLSGLIFLFGAYLNVAYYRMQKQKLEIVTSV